VASPGAKSLDRRWRPRLLVESLEDRCLLDAGYLQTNLVSDVPGLATNTDPNLKNPWGLVAGPGGPWWVSDQATSVSTLYNGAGQGFPVGSPLVVNIPAGAHGTPPFTGPTGIAFNGSSDFVVSQGGNSGPALFIFATLDGTIAGWSFAVNFTQAVTAVDNSGAGASYTGLALATSGGANYLYAANFGAGTVDVFNATFQPTTLAGSFTDPNLPSGFAPYDIQSIGDKLYVTYAAQNLSPGGVVDVFNTDGTPGLPHGQVRLITGGNLNLPWGMAIAPHNFGQFGNALLVGNVGDGHIDAYNPHTGAFRGQLEDTSGNPIAIPGLWSLKFGNDGLAGSSDTLFFTAGLNTYADGLLGSLSVPQHAVASHHISESIIPNLPASPTLSVSTVPAVNGDLNPYGIAFVPPHFAGGGPLNPGDILVSNFNNSSNAQGTGSTIVQITPNGQQSVFFQGPSTGIGLTTALGVLKSGFVIVGNVPTDSNGNAQNGSLMIIDRNGNLVDNLTDSALLQGPWDLAVNDDGRTAQIFVSNVLSGTVTRIDLTIPDGSNPIVESLTQIASGYLTRTDPAALVVGPTGLAFDRAHNVLYVASTGDNEIFAIPHAKHRSTDAGMGDLVYQDNVHLHGPLGLLLAPNGDLITANGDAVNPDPTQQSELVEFTPTGQFVAQLPVDPSAGAAFGIALQFAGPDSQVRFAAVDDATNTIDVWNIDLDGSHPAARSLAAAIASQPDLTAIGAANPTAVINQQAINSVVAALLQLGSSQQDGLLSANTTPNTWQTSSALAAAIASHGGKDLLWELDIELFG
jgi:uncharacterized protein (TIGR03118 family)